MPGFNGRGPLGRGAMTGGGRGYCAIPLSDQTDMFTGYGFCGKGRGRGARNRFYQRERSNGEAHRGVAPVSSEDELSRMKEQAAYLIGQLESLQQKIKQLETK